ncbi:small multidrug efflux protein [Agromyces humatus]|uniref:Small multidrug efflux protein n=1 Tax=Agromyces humatus TaxID=279573 RepID=A0ABN2KHK2_9MICO|nr:small multidrug efflux protein [Agromyces humatus]
MNPIQELITNFQNLVTQVPEIIQPFIVMLAGTIPFIEGELASMIGIVGGLNPIVAAIAAAAGNFLSVLLVVLLTSRARSAVVSRSSVRVAATVGAEGAPPFADDESAPAFMETAPAKPESKGRQRLKKWLTRYGVPGASILGPLAIPTQFTSAFLVAGGTSRAWVLLWQAVAIILWTTVTTVSAWAALTFVVGV